MIISALVKRYEDTMEVPVGWQKREVSYALDIDEKGNLLGVMYLSGSDDKKVNHRNFILPEAPARSSGIDAGFLCDNGSYFLGLDDKRGQEKFDAAKKLHKDILQNMDSPTARAICGFFDRGIPDDIEKYVDLNSAAKENFIFQVDGLFVDHKSIDLRNAWDEWKNKSYEQEDDILCLINGKKDKAERIHGTISLRGGQTSGSRLISANAESFASYGKTVKHRAAEIGRYAAFAYVTALNALIKDNNHYKYIGSDTLIYWAEKGGEQEESLFGNLLDPPKVDD
ncbi:MAG: type I-C CRISPR-associated protein Cas8c/Csd1, partial [Clostridiales bacterium]|nr:type I-C CRISPR-associated protein Cas8c/Csd1 [Clostridiales bacterium]